MDTSQGVINDIKEIFGIKNYTSSEPVKSSTYPNSTKISYMDQQKAIYPNAYQPWTQDDDQQLLFLYSQGKNLYELMEIFGRNEGAIRSRISKLTE